MNYLELQESIKNMTAEEYITKVVKSLIVKGETEIVSVVKADAPYETHYNVNLNVTVPKSDLWVAVAFQPADWYGVSVSSYYHGKDFAHISLSVRNDGMPHVRHLNIVMTIKRARK